MGRFSLHGAPSRSDGGSPHSKGRPPSPGSRERGLANRNDGRVESHQPAEIEKALTATARSRIRYGRMCEVNCVGKRSPTLDARSSGEGLVRKPAHRPKLGEKGQVVPDSNLQAFVIRPR